MAADGRGAGGDDAAATARARQLAARRAVERDNPAMRVRFTKMQGAGNDFVVLDATRAPLALDDAQMQALGRPALRRRRRPDPDRREGAARRASISATASSTAAAATRSSSAATARAASSAIVRDKGLSDKTTLAVETMNRRLELRLAARRPGDGRHGRARSSTRRRCRSTPPGSRRASPRAGCRSGRSSSAKAAASRWRWCRWATRTRCRSSPTSTPRRSRRTGR